MARTVKINYPSILGGENEILIPSEAISVQYAANPVTKDRMILIYMKDTEERVGRFVLEENEAKKIAFLINDLFSQNKPVPFRFLPGDSV